MLLVAELEMHWVNLGDDVHVLHQAKAIIWRVLVDWNLIKDAKSTFDCMFCEKPFTNDRRRHILACSIIQPNAVGTESEPIILSSHSKQDFSVLIRDGLSTSPTLDMLLSNFLLWIHQITSIDFSNDLCGK
jgi:hypothetical protein